MMPGIAGGLGSDGIGSTADESVVGSPYWSKSFDNETAEASLTPPLIGSLSGTRSH